MLSNLKGEISPKDGLDHFVAFQYREIYHAHVDRLDAQRCIWSNMYIHMRRVKKRQTQTQRHIIECLDLGQVDNIILSHIHTHTHISENAWMLTQQIFNFDLKQSIFNRWTLKDVCRDFICGCLGYVYGVYSWEEIGRINRRKFLYFNSNTHRHRKRRCSDLFAGLFLFYTVYSGMLQCIVDSVSFHWIYRCDSCSIMARKWSFLSMLSLLCSSAFLS